MLKLLWDLFYAFAKVGSFGFGGGPAMIPLVQKEVVDANAWLTNREFTDALAMGNALPGPIATKMATYVGWKMAGPLGTLAGILGLLLPSWVLMLMMTIFFLQFKDLPSVQGMLKAVRPVVVALLAFTAWEMFRPSVRSWDTALIAVLAFVAVAILDLHPALIILLAAILGLVAYGGWWG